MGRPLTHGEKYSIVFYSNVRTHKGALLLNRQAYLAELTQLLYYMTPWDREAAIAKYDKLLADAEDVDALVGEIGTPMKVAVTLSRGYEASPQPDPNAPKAVPEPEPEAPKTEDIPEAEAPAQEETVPEEAPQTEESAPEAEEAPAPEPVPEVEEAPSEPPEVEAVEITTVEEAEPEVPEKEPPNTQAVPGEEGIFSEIFTAATQAQSAVALETAAKRRSPRPGVLIPYVILCILLGVPVALVLLAIDLVIFAIALTALVFGVYLLILSFSSGFTGLGNHLVALGLVILGLTVAIAVSALGVWFMQNAVTGFVGFLIRFGQEHGYREGGSV